MHSRTARSSARLRPLAVIPVVAAGLLTTLATGGGDQSKFAPGGTLLTITAGNAHDVASAVIQGVGITLDFADVTGGQIPSDTGGSAAALLQKSRVDRLTAQYSAPFGPTEEPCGQAGTITLSGDVAVPGTISAGDTITAEFNDCDDNEGYILNGQLTLTVRTFSGDLLTGLYLTTIDVDAANLTTDGESVDGSVTLTVDTRDPAMLDLTLTGARLALAAAGETYTLTNFRHYVEEGLLVSSVYAELAGTIDIESLGGAVEYATVVPVEAGEFDPDRGEILITGALRSTVRIVFVSATSIRLDVDVNGDGIVDNYIDTNWAALNGRSSTVNSSTALAISRAAVAATNGFGAAVLTPGSQFQASAPFALLAQQGISGSFGPVQIACPITGSASLSGTIASAGTYSAGDQLSAVYDTCTRTADTLHGSLDVTVTAFEGIVGGNYRATTTSQHTALERSGNAQLSIGTGTLNAIYDQAYTVAGRAQASGTSNSFALTSGPITRTLSSAAADVTVDMGAFPRTVTRAVSGLLTSPELQGSYSLSSDVADMFVADTDPATGPFAGELRVTASDTSSVTIIALDAYNVRLAIDLDGDSFTDEEIDTTWLALQ